MTQPSAILPVNPFTALTTIVSLTLMPALVEIVGVVALTVKSFTESVTLFVRVIPSPVLVPLIVMLASAAGVIPEVVPIVTRDWFPGVVPGVTLAGFAVQVTLAGNPPQLTVMGWFIPPSGV